MQKLLFISNFPINKPMHGGQIRSSELVDKYKSLGFNVKVLVIKPEGTYLDDSADYEFVIPNYEMHQDRFQNANPYLDDYLRHFFVLNNMQRIVNKIGTDYDYIHCEMPWLFELGYQISTKNRRTRLILGTENVESELKLKILMNAKIDEDVVNLVIAEIDSLEKRAARDSSIILTVSDYDNNYFRKITSSEKVVLVKNGINKNRFLSKDDTILKQVTESYFVFVGSAHMPNASGFGEIFSHSLSFLPPDVNIVVVGGVSKLLERDPRFLKYKHLNNTRLKLFDHLETEKLNSLILNSVAILLPIIDGGGSNLKTAEALFSNKSIIATEKSFIGYESYMHSEGVIIANDSFDFAKSMIECLNERHVNNRRNLDNLTWDATLSEITKIMGVSYE